MDGSFDVDDSSEGSGIPSLTFVQAELLAFGVFLLGFGIVDYVLGGRYELHIMIDAAGAYCFPITVIYFYYPLAALCLSLFGCLCLILYFGHHMYRTRLRGRLRLSPVSIGMILITLYIAQQSLKDIERIRLNP